MTHPRLRARSAHPAVAALVLLASAAGTSRSTRALADVKGPAMEEAKQHYLRGSAAFEQGHFDEAALEFREAYRLSGKPDLLYNIGQTSMRRGDAARAVEAYEDYLRGKPDAPDRVQIEATIVNLRAQTGRVLVDGATPGALIEVDGTPAGTAPLAGPVLVTIGKRRIVERGAEGTPPRSVEVTVLPGQDVRADLNPVIAPPPPPPPPPAPRGMSKLGLGVGGGGLALVAVGAVLLALVPGTVSDAKAATTEDAFASLESRATGLRNGGIVLVAVGAAAAAAGVAIVLFEGRRGSAVRVSLAPSTSGLFAEGRF